MAIEKEYCDTLHDEEQEERSCKITFPDKVENSASILIFDESSPMSKEAFDYMIERAAARTISKN